MLLDRVERLSYFAFEPVPNPSPGQPGHRMVPVYAYWTNNFRAARRQRRLFHRIPEAAWRPLWEHRHHRPPGQG